MIFRRSQTLNGKIKAGTLPALPLHENPFADWSAALYVAGRTQYILLCNTKSLYKELQCFLNMRQKNSRMASSTLPSSGSRRL